MQQDASSAYHHATHAYRGGQRRGKGRHKEKFGLDVEMEEDGGGGGEEERPLFLHCLPRQQSHHGGEKGGEEEMSPHPDTHTVFPEKEGKCC